MIIKNLMMLDSYKCFKMVFFEILEMHCYIAERKTYNWTYCFVEQSQQKTGASETVLQDSQESVPKAKEIGMLA